ncbi:MAG: hypothetical protein MJE66_02895 [Proteobacteria bacterium]|nr:hypothetical protein [Pseudomonadota bacterium]
MDFESSATRSDEPIPPVALGSVLVSLLDPSPGHEVEFHRWYERDHFYSGCMIGPWFFSGRRFVATRALKELRYPETTPVIDDIVKGSYLALYWILAGREQEAESWAVRQVRQLIAEDRMLVTRRPAQAGFYRHRWSVSRDPDGVPAELALEHPFAGTTLMMVDRAPGVSAEELDRWYRQEYLPATLPGSEAALCIALDPVPLPDDAPAYVPRPPGLDRRCLHLYFLDREPAECWKALFASHGERIASLGLGEVTYAAPFIPTIPGTDRYADELW